MERLYNKKGATPEAGPAHPNDAFESGNIPA